jgi:hypothetical protein
MVTTEGIAFQMSNDLKNVGGTTKEIINSSKALPENATTALLDTIFFTNLTGLFYNRLVPKKAPENPELFWALTCYVIRIFISPFLALQAYC